MTTLHHTDPTSCRQTRARNLEPLSPQTEQGLGFPFPPVTLTHCLKHGPIYRSMVWSKPWQMNQTAWKPAHPTVKFQAEAGQDYDHSGIHRNKSLDLCGKGLQIPKNVRRLLPHIFPNVKKTHTKKHTHTKKLLLYHFINRLLQQVQETAATNGNKLRLWKSGSCAYYEEYLVMIAVHALTVSMFDFLLLHIEWSRLPFKISFSLPFKVVQYVAVPIISIYCAKSSLCH